MSFSPFLRYSKKMKNAALRPLNTGQFTHDHGMFLAHAKVTKQDDGWEVTLSLLVDPLDGVIADAKFQAFGPSYLIATADLLAEFLLQKHYGQMRRMTLPFLVKEMSDEEPFPEECTPALTCLLELLSTLSHLCEEASLPAAPTTPFALDHGTTHTYPPWEGLSKPDRLALIEKVLDEEIRPYVALDEGGVTVIDLIDNQLTIAYEGSCTSCHASSGSTLSAIESILAAKLHPALTVTPL